MEGVGRRELVRGVGGGWGVRCIGGYRCNSSFLASFPGPFWAWK